MDKNLEKILNYYNALSLLYVDKIEEHKDCFFVHSDIVDDGIWNFILVKENGNYKETFEAYKSKFNRRIPRFYLLNPKTSLLKEILKRYKIYCEDSWFITKVNDLDFYYKGKLNISIKNANKEDVIETIINGFSTHNPEDPYGDLSPTYRTCLEQKFKTHSQKYEIKHFVAYYWNKPISIASITYDKNTAFLNNVTTLKEYKGNGIAKQILSEILIFLKSKNIKEICFATEKNAYTESFYSKLGFKIVSYGYCFEE